MDLCRRRRSVCRVGYLSSTFRTGNSFIVLSQEGVQWTALQSVIVWRLFYSFPHQTPLAFQEKASLFSPQKKREACWIENFWVQSLIWQLHIENLQTFSPKSVTSLIDVLLSQVSILDLMCCWSQLLSLLKGKSFQLRCSLGVTHTFKHVNQGNCWIEAMYRKRDSGKNDFHYSNL